MDGNRKTAHLKLCDGASEIIADGRTAQEKFVAVTLQGFDQNETEKIKSYFNQILRNINAYLKEEN